MTITGIKTTAALLCLGTSLLCGPVSATDRDCITSETHNLVLGDKGYQCLKAANHCESDFSQAESRREDCESRDGCKFLPAFCYCPPELLCVCGGGPPLMCVLASDDREFIRRHQSFLDGTNHQRRPLGESDGELRELGDDLVAWDAQAGRWVTPVDFWRAYAKRRGGLSWGRSAEYPPYAEVDELDTFMVETNQGPCLMEFFHSRWRRANDVRRWDDQFNEVLGCPYVFD